MNARDFEVLARRSFPWVARAVDLGARFVCFGDGSQTVRCYDSSSFEPIWSTKVPAKSEGVLCRIDGQGEVVLAQTYNLRASRGTLFRLNGETGEVMWQRKLMRYSPSTPCVAEGQVFVAADKRLEAFGVEDGRAGVRVDHLLGSASLHSWQATREILGVDLRGNLVAFRSPTLELVRSLDLGIRNPMVFAPWKDQLLIGGRDRGVHRLDVKTWCIEHTYRVSAYSQCLVEGSRAWLQTEQDNFEGHRFGAVDLEAGELLWEVPLPFDPHRSVHSPCPMCVRRGLVWIRDTDGPVPIYALSADTGEMHSAFTMELARRVNPSLASDGKAGHPFLLKGQVYVSIAEEMWCIESQPCQ